MAFTISVHEQDTYMYQLISDRLRSGFPDAYICRDTDLPEDNSISKYTIDLYDNSRLGKRRIAAGNDISGLYSNPVPIYTFKDGTWIADMRSVEDAIRRIKNDPEMKDPSYITRTGPGEHKYGKLAVVLPFTYADEREEYIKTAFDGMRDADSMCIRIDLMSGARMPSSFRTDLTDGSLTTLLKHVRSPSFLPKDILDYLNPDSMGYLTPGMPDLNDDVYDLGTDAAVCLLRKLKALICDTEGAFNALAVIEGYRLDDLKKLIEPADELHVLLPADKCNTEGFDEFIRTLKKCLTSEADLIVHHTEPVMKRITK